MSISQTVSYAQNFCPLPAFGLHCNAIHCIGEYECTTVHSHREASFDRVEEDTRRCSIAPLGPQCSIVLLLQHRSGIALVQDSSPTAGVQHRSGIAGRRSADTQWEGATLSSQLPPPTVQWELPHPPTKLPGVGSWASRKGTTNTPCGKKT